MNGHSPRRLASALVVGALAAVGIPAVVSGQTPPGGEPVRRTLAFGGSEREYFLRLPPRFDSTKSYRPLVVVHGAGGNGRTFFLATGIARLVAERGLNAIVIAPSFRNDDDNASRFPALGEGAFLDEVLKQVRAEYRLEPRILLTGYSRGGQFAHRYALVHPERVAAVAPFASGSWTTPDGRFLAEGIGEVRDPKSFLSDSANASKLPPRFRDLFEPRVAAVVDARAAAGAGEVPYLVMCGTLDPRQSIAKEFVNSLKALGYQVAVAWPRTPHGCRDAACRAQYAAEFEQYSQRAVEFFERVTPRR